MTSVVNMAGGQFVIWEKGTVVFANGGSVATNTGANVLSCGGRSWNVAVTVSTSKLIVELPASTVADNAGVTAAADTVVCGVGSIELFMKGWVDDQTYNGTSLNAESTTCKCYAGRSNSVTDSNAECNVYHADAAWTWPAPANPSGGILYLSISEVAFTPNTLGS